MRRTALAKFTLAAALFAAAANATPAFAAPRVADITRMDAQREDTLTGIGLVFGLDGSGDGGDFAPSIRMLSQALGHFNAAASVAELSDVDNVAIVALTATVPENGVRAGDKLDVHVTSIGAAKSLEGGRLFVTPLTGPVPGSGYFALANGGLILDKTVPTVAKIEGGAVMEVDMARNFIKNGKFTLVLSDEHANFTNASHIARMINDAEQTDARYEVAIAIDSKNIQVIVPPTERARPDSFVSRVMRLPVPIIAEEAIVRINERLATIVISGDVEIDPTIISMNGLTISTEVQQGNVQVQAPGIGGVPQVEEKVFVPMGTDKAKLAKLKDLLSALDQLKVPAEDRIAILKELHKSGKMHAKLVVE